MDLFKSLLAVKIVGIDNRKRFVHHILAAKDGMACSPGFRSVLGFCEAGRKGIKLLEYIFHFAHLFYSVSDYFAEILLDGMTDDKNYLVKARTACVIYRIVHEYFIARSDLCQLFDSAAVS